MGRLARLAGKRKGKTKKVFKFFELQRCKIKNLIARYSMAKEFNKKKISDIPSRPQNFYEEWETWGDFLGTGRVAARLKKFEDFSKLNIIIFFYKYIFVFN